MFRQVPVTTVGREHTKTDINSKTCKLSCCFSCSFCNRAATKERPKSRIDRCKFKRVSIKICQKCFFCHSIVLCESCNKCPTCCTKSTCRVQTSNFWAKLGGSGCRSKSSSNVETGLHPPLLDQTKSVQISHCRKPVCQSPQEQLPVGGIATAYRQKCYRTSSKSVFSRVFQPTFLSSETQQKMEANTRPEQTKYLSQSRKIQNGDTGNHQNIPPARGVGNLSRFQRRLLPYTNTGTVQEISKISCPGSDISIQGSTFRSVHSTHGVHCSGQGGETDSHAQGYKNPPVPRRLVGERHILPHLSPTHRNPSQNLSGSRLAGEHREVGTGAQAGLRLRRLPVRPEVRPGPTDAGPVAKPSRQDKNTLGTSDLFGPAVHVPDRSANGHRETSSSWPTTHEAYTVASQKQLEDTRILRKGYPSTQVSAPPPAMVAGGRKCTPRPTTTSLTPCSADLYRRIKRRLGRSLKRAHCKRSLISAGKQATHKLSGVKSGFPSFKRVSKSLYRQDSSSGDRQHHRSSLHKQGRRHEVGPPVCPSLEDLDLVFPATSDSTSPSYPGPSKCDSRQTIQAGPDHPNRVVPPSGGFSEIMQQVAPASDRPVCHKIQPQVTSVCVPSTGPPAVAVDALTLPWEDLDAYAFPPTSILGKVVEKLTHSPCRRLILIAPGWPNMPWFWDLVNMSSQVPLSLPNLPNLLTQPFNQIHHQNLTNLNLHAWLLEPCQSRNRVSLRQWQQELRLLKEDQPDQSTKQSGPFLQSGASLIRWTSGHHL